MAIVSAMRVRMRFGVAGMVPCDRGMPGSFRRTMGISGGVGVVAVCVAVVTMPGRVVSVGVGGIRMVSSGMGIRTVVIGMVSVTGRAFITGNGGVC